MAVRSKLPGNGKKIVVDPKNTHKYFAEHDERFKSCCLSAKVKPCKRQASKFRRKFGIAYKQVPLL